MGSSIVPELHALAPAILSQTRAAVTTQSECDKVHALLKRGGEHWYLFAANTVHTPRLATFRAEALARFKRMRVLGEARAVELSQGQLRDRFKGHEVHIYTTNPTVETPSVPRVLERIEQARRALHKPGNLAFEGLGVVTDASSVTRWHDSHLLVDGLTSGK